MDALTDVLRSERSVAGAMLVLIALLVPASGFVGAFGLPMDVWGMPLERKLRTIQQARLFLRRTAVRIASGRAYSYQIVTARGAR